MFLSLVNGFPFFGEFQDTICWSNERCLIQSGPSCSFATPNRLLLTILNSSIFAHHCSIAQSTTLVDSIPFILAALPNHILLMQLPLDVLYSHHRDTPQMGFRFKIQLCFLSKGVSSSLLVSIQRLPIINVLGRPLCMQGGSMPAFYQASFDDKQPTVLNSHIPDRLLALFKMIYKSPFNHAYISRNPHGSE